MYVISNYVKFFRRSKMRPGNSEEAAKSLNILVSKVEICYRASGRRYICEAACSALAFRHSLRAVDEGQAGH